MSEYRYELWFSGHRLARYRTLGQALLGAVWRSRKRGNKKIYVYETDADGGKCIAYASGGFPDSSFE